MVSSAAAQGAGHDLSGLPCWVADQFPEVHQWLMLKKAGIDHNGPALSAQHWLS